MKRLRDVVLVVFGAVGILALARQALEPEALEAVAIPAAQKDVDTDLQQFNTEFFVPVPGSSVTINNGTQTRRVVIQFSAEVAVGDNNDSMELGYAIPSECFPQAGPLRFASSANWATYTAIHVPTLGPGQWMITPCVRIVDVDRDGIHIGALRIRTLTAEGTTK